MNLTKLFPLLLISWITPALLHIFISKRLNNQINSMGKKYYKSSDMSVKKISIQLGGRVEVTGIKFKTRKYDINVPLGIISPVWKNTFSHEKLLNLNLFSPKIELTVTTNNQKTEISRNRGLLKKLISHLNIHIESGTLKIKKGNNLMSLLKFRGQSYPGKQFVLNTELITYEGDYGLWIGKNVSFNLTGERLNHVTVQFLKLFSKSKINLSVTGSISTITKSTLEYDIKLANKDEFLKIKGIGNLHSNIMKSKFVINSSIDTISKMLKTTNIKLPQRLKLAGNIKGSCNLVYDGQVKLFNSNLKVLKLKVSHPALAQKPIFFPSLKLGTNLKFNKKAYKAEIKTDLGNSIESNIKVSYYPLHNLLINVNTPIMDCNSLLGAIPHDLIPHLKGLSLEGKTSFHFTSQIPLKDIEKLQASLQFKGVGCSIKNHAKNINISLLNKPVEVVLIDDLKHKTTRIMGTESKFFTPLNKFPFHLLDAFIAAEDMKFYKHHGFDWAMLMKALGVNLANKTVIKGASSITQQLAKNLYLSSARTLSRKLEEAIITWQIEKLVPKNRILELYLNIIEMGPGLRGIKQGALTYFGKEPRNLTPIEAAHLASIIPAPRFYYKKLQKSFVPEWWSKHIRKLLWKMYKYGKLTKTRYKEQYKKELVLSDY